MTSNSIALPRSLRLSIDVRGLLTLLVVLGSGAVGVAVALPGYERLVLAVGIAVLLGALAITSPLTGLLGLAAWLVALGTIRRIAPGVSLSGLGDPLLLVEPAVLVLLLLGLPQPRNHGGRMSVLAYAVLAFQVLAALSVLNPLQGGLEVGMAGLLFVPVPMLAFWIGRALPSTVVARLLRFIALLSIPVALYGLWQTLIGFPSWDVQWITGVVSNYMALHVGAGIRAFASLSSYAEYASVLTISVVVFVAGMRRSAFSLAPLPLIALLVASVLLESNRSVVVTGVLAVGAVTAARAGWSPRRTVISGALLLVALVVASGLLASAALGAGPLSGLLAHQVQGLANPFGAPSTLPLHIDILLTGLRAGLSTGVGLGVGAVSIAAGRFGGVTAGTEVDPGNAAVALGIPGLLLYLMIAVTGLWRAYTLARTRQDVLALALLGVLMVTGLQWLNGGQYAVAWVVWLAFGAVDSEAGACTKLAQRRPNEDVPVPVAVSRKARPAGIVHAA